MKDKIKTIVFDFDGVIVDSNRLKLDAWFKIFPADLGVTHEEIVESLERVRETRFDILRDIFLKKGIEGEKNAAMVAEYAEKWNSIVQKGMVLMPGVSDILLKTSAKFPLYINSATPVEPLRETVKNLAIGQYFKDVMGKPPDKVENLQSVLRREEARPEELIFVGDAEGDLLAARAVGCRFIGLKNEFNGWREATGFSLIKELSELVAPDSLFW